MPDVGLSCRTLATLTRATIPPAPCWTQTSSRSVRIDDVVEVVTFLFEILGKSRGVPGVWKRDASPVNERLYHSRWDVEHRGDRLMLIDQPEKRQT